MHSSYQLLEEKKRVAFGNKMWEFSRILVIIFLTCVVDTGVFLY